MKPAVVILSMVMAALQFAVADDFKTTGGKEYKDATVSRVEPDGIVLKTKSGISKVYFSELPKEVQEHFHYTAPVSPQPRSSGATDSQRSAALMSQAESALRSGQFGQGAELLNRIVTEYPTSRQAQTVYDLRAIIREKQQTQSGPLTADDARRLRSLMDAVANIKRDYYTATPEKRRALETIFGAEMFRSTDNSLDSVSSSGAKLRDSIDKARQGQ
jgi:hypothetical protein